MFIKLQGRAIDMTGRRFGRLVALGPCERIKRDFGTQIKWRCSCDCGNEVTVAGGDLRGGKTNSCGCLLSEASRRRKTRHGKARKPEYTTWRGMRDRCEQQSHVSYHLYGGKGVTVCERWKDFENFWIDMGQRPSPHHSIDRIDSKGHYEPGNCRWATRREQAANISRNLIVTAFGRTGPLCTFVKTDDRRVYTKIRDRIVKLGWEPEKALTLHIPSGSVG